MGQMIVLRMFIVVCVCADALACLLASTLRLALDIALAHGGVGDGNADGVGDDDQRGQR